MRNFIVILFSLFTIILFGQPTITNPYTNHAGQLIQMTDDGKLPPLDGSYVTGIVSTPGEVDYNNLINKPTIPTNTNQLTNGAGFITSYSEIDPVYSAWNKATGITITESQVTNLATDLAAKQATLTRNTGLIVYAALSNGTTEMAFGTNSTVKVTPTATATYTTTVSAAGTECTLIILTSGTTSRTITFGSGFKPISTLATGTVTAKLFTIKFISDGTNLIETGRTTAH